MYSTRGAASLIAAIAMFFTAAACAGDADRAADTAAGVVGSTAAATTTPDADRVDDRVEVALSTDSILRGFGLDADEDDGRIVLKGAVRTEAQKTAATEVATRVASGVSIDNRIRVAANARMSNETPDVDDVEEQVEKAFDDDATLKPLNLDVDEDNGQIVLEGTVRTADQKTAAEQLAKRIAGTVVVVNRFRVQ
jgi:osmotically-inducible protein OsmY